MIKVSIYLCKFEVIRRGIYIATAVYVAFEMPSEGKNGKEQYYRIETRFNRKQNL
jgi:hypothetical protein